MQLGLFNLRAHKQAITATARNPRLVTIRRKSLVYTNPWVKTAYQNNFVKVLWDMSIFLLGLIDIAISFGHTCKIKNFYYQMIIKVQNYLDV